MSVKGTTQIPLTASQHANLVASKTGQTRAEFTDEHKANLSAAGSGVNNSMYGKTHTESSKDAMRAAKLGKKRATKMCPHCGTDVAVHVYSRWHGDNCKKKK